MLANSVNHEEAPHSVCSQFGLRHKHCAYCGKGLDSVGFWEGQSSYSKHSYIVCLCYEISNWFVRLVITRIKRETPCINQIETVSLSLRFIENTIYRSISCDYGTFWSVSIYSSNEQAQPSSRTK